MGKVEHAVAGMGPMWMVPTWCGDMGKCVPVQKGVRWTMMLTKHMSPEYGLGNSSGMMLDGQLGGAQMFRGVCIKVSSRRIFDHLHTRTARNAIGSALGLLRSDQHRTEQNLQ